MDKATEEHGGQNGAASATNPKASTKYTGPLRTLPQKYTFGHFLRGGGTERGVRDICVASACAHARHTDDTHACPRTTLFVVSKSTLVASSARHLLVSKLSKKKTYPPFRSPPFNSSSKIYLKMHPKSALTPIVRTRHDKLCPQVMSGNCTHVQYGSSSEGPVAPRKVLNLDFFGFGGL